MAAGRHLGFSKFGISDQIFQFLLCLGIFSSNFSQKAQSTHELLTYMWIQDGGRRHLGLKKNFEWLAFFFKTVTPKEYLCQFWCFYPEVNDFSVICPLLRRHLNCILDHHHFSAASHCPMCRCVRVATKRPALPDVSVCENKQSEPEPAASDFEIAASSLQSANTCIASGRLWPQKRRVLCVTQSSAASGPAKGRVVPLSEAEQEVQLLLEWPRGFTVNASQRAIVDVRSVGPLLGLYSVVTAKCVITPHRAHRNLEDKIWSSSGLKKTSVLPVALPPKVGTGGEFIFFW